jgi:drug/metabolite transporter (DMT)-like permease
MIRVTSKALLSKTSAVSARAYLALLAGVVAISFTAIFTKWAGVPGPVAAAWRMAVAALVLLIPFLHQVHQRRPALREGVLWAIGGGLWFALNLGLLNSALLLTSAATATLLDNTAPIWVGIGATVFFRERLCGQYWAGLVLALAGASVVTGFTLADGIRLSPGHVLAALGAIFYAAYLLTTQRARRALDALSYLWLMAATATLALFSGSLALGLPLLGYSCRSYLALVAVGVICQTAGWWLINFALGHLSASTAVVVLLAQPVVTGLLAMSLLAEPLLPRQIGGGLLELAGIYLCVRSRAGQSSGES